MKIKSRPLFPLRRLLPRTVRTGFYALMTLASLTAALSVQASSQTWTNAPVDNTWSNVNNWVGLAVPGGISLTGNSVVSDIATFNTPIPASGIGGPSRPILIDDSSNPADRSRQIGGITFDTTNCGAYVFSGTTPAVYPNIGILYVTHAGSITMNASVTNSQTFLLPILTRLPSSTAGVYNFVNNSTNSFATLQIDSVTNDSAATRGTTFVLDGSNTGTNTIYELSQDGIFSTGISSLTKQGAGTWYLPGANMFRTTSAMIIDRGLLVAQNVATFGSATTATVESNATLRIDGVVLDQTTLTVQQSGTILINGSTTVPGVTVSTALTGTSPTLATSHSGEVMTVGTAANAVTGGAASSVLNVSGPGTVFLGQSDNYIGSWSLNAGTTQLGNAAALGTGPNLNIGAGAILDVSPITTGSGTYGLGTVALSASGTGIVAGSTAATINADPSGIVDLATGSKQITLTFTPAAFAGDTAHPALFIAQGTLKLGGNAFAIDNASGTPLGVGTYTLIKQATGSITDGGGYSVIGVTGSGVASGNVASVVVSGGSLNLIINAYIPKNLVWTGGAANANWDLGADANWLNGVSASVFNNSDTVTFNSVGSTNPTVTLLGTLAPGTVTVSSANNYAFAGSGQIAGSTSLTKSGTGTLLVSTVNTYSGGTTINGGIFQLGAINAIPSTGAGDVTLANPATLDLNGFSDTINALSGNGTVDSVAGGSPVLSVGGNNDSGTFFGVIQNTAGTVGLTKNGNGTETLTSASTYAGATTINAGTLSVANLNALGSGLSAVTVNGTLDLQTSVLVNALGGSGTVANNSTATTNTLIITNTATFNGLIVDGSAGGGVAVTVNSGIFRLNSASTYSGGTIVESGANLQVGQASSPGSGGIILSNNTTVNLPTASSVAAAIGNNITTVDGATASFSSGETANSFNDQFYGSVLATNVFVNGIMSIGGTNSFNNFFGTVIVTNGQLRMFNALCGGTNTVFDFVGGGGMYARDADIVSLGALFGDSTALITAPSVTPFGTYWIGAKNINSVYSGTISGSNNIVKTGTGTFTLDCGNNIVTNIVQDGLFITTNIAYGVNLISYVGTTTISNGVLALAGQANLTNSPVITLAAPTAVLNGLAMAFISTDNSTFTNLLTNGVFEVVSGQTLAGEGNILASNVLLDAGSTLAIGLPYGQLTANQHVELGGTVTANVNVTNTPNSGELLAPQFTVDGTAVLLVTNLGPENAATFQLFNHPVSFTSVVLPVLVGATNSWVNNLAVNGSITLVAPQFVAVNPNPTNITFTVSGGNTINLAWPADHTGWSLQIQTNTLATGLGTNWVTLPGSTLVDSTNLPISPANGSVFYRLMYP